MELFRDAAKAEADQALLQDVDALAQVDATYVDFLAGTGRV
jgi:hypothetical protein